jgi:hypothetical protein
MTEVPQTAIGDSVGSLIEASLRAAGKQLSTHRLLGMRVPHNTGAITVDVTQNSRLFYNPKKGCAVGWRGLVCLSGPEVVAGDYEVDGNTAWEEQIQAEWLSLAPFVVDGERLVQAGALVHNPTLKYMCLDCSRTYNCAKLLAARLGNRHSCGHCCTEAERRIAATGQRVTGRDRMRIQAQYKLRHVVGTASRPPKLGHEEVAAIKFSLKQGPAQGYCLPRPICMFQPGAVECLWEPEENDTLGKQLLTRCRNANANQQPIPLRMALAAYGNPPVQMPGLLGIVLLLSPDICGWQPVTVDNGKDGWEVVMPRNRISEKPKVEEV